MPELTCMELELKKGIPNFIRLCEESFKKDATDKNVGSKTNADRIRSMTDEELCKFLGECKFCDICEEGCDSCTYNGDCDKRLLEWLQQPAEVE